MISDEKTYFRQAMKHFPVTHSILSAEHITLFLEETYFLNNNITCRLIKSGINDTYLVTTIDNKFVFRIYSFNWRSETEIREEIRLLNDLNQHEIPVSYPVPDKNKQYIQILNAPEGDRFAVLFSYAAGEKLNITSEENHFRIGQLMARFHAITIDQSLNRIDYTPKVILIEPMKQITRFLSPESEEMQFMQTTQKHLLQEFQNADISQLRKGVVHMDIWFDNLNITDNNEITLFDFDFCGKGWIAFDIAYYILQLHNVEKYEINDYQPKVDSFLKGYESLKSITAEEKRLLPILGVSMYFFYLGIQCQRFDNWSNSFLNENYLKRFINGLVKRYYEIYELGGDKN
jgi:Ser/Thr protein kinase RdoA (MazF antagonist)